MIIVFIVFILLYVAFVEPIFNEDDLRPIVN